MSGDWESEEDSNHRGEGEESIFSKGKVGEMRKWRLWIHSSRLRKK